MTERPDQSKTVPLTPVDSPGGIPRREALQALLGGVGAGFALTSIVEAQHPVHEHLASPASVEHAQQKAAVAAYIPEFLDEHQLKTLEVLAEAIVPGSTAARVAPFLDQLLAVESAQSQRRFLGALGAFEMAAIAKHGKGWNAISASEQDALLRDASTADAKSSMRRTISRTSRAGLSAPTILRSLACASWVGPATCSLRSSLDARIQAAIRRDSWSG